MASIWDKRGGGARRMPPRKREGGVRAATFASVFVRARGRAAQVRYALSGDITGRRRMTDDKDGRSAPRAAGIFGARRGRWLTATVATALIGAAGVGAVDDSPILIEKQGSFAVGGTIA